MIIVRNFLWAALIFLFPAVVFLLLYVTVYHAPTSSIAPHLCVLSSAFLGVVGLKVALTFLQCGRRLKVALNAFVAVSLSFALVGFYGLVFAGLSFWGRVPTIDIFRTYAIQANHLLPALGYKPPFFWLVIGAIAIASWAIAYLYQLRFDWARNFSRFISAPVRAIISVGLISTSTILFSALPDRGWAASAEPLSLSLYPEFGALVMQNHSIDVIKSNKIDQQDALARQFYYPSKDLVLSNVILIVVDALRADHVSLLGYKRETMPHLEARANAGALYLKGSAVSVCNESSCGLRALVSSRYLDQQAKNPITLNEVLKINGYRTNLILSGDHTNFYGLRDIYGSVDTYFDAVHQSARYVNDDRMVVDRLKSLAPFDGSPTMFQFHLMSAHALGQRFDDTPSFGASENYTGYRVNGVLDPELFERTRNFYDRGVLQADVMIEKILGDLAAKGYLEHAIVILTGDHGESLGERGRYSHTHSVWEESLRVPFIVFNYGYPVVERNGANLMLSQVDIAPTILEALGIPIPSTWQGMPIQSENRPNTLYFQQTRQIGLVDNRQAKGIYKHWIDMESGAEFTFDLKNDAGESKNITDQIPDDLRRAWRIMLAERFSTTAPGLNALVSDLKH